MREYQKEFSSVNLIQNKLFTKAYYDWKINILYSQYVFIVYYPTRIKDSCELAPNGSLAQTALEVFMLRNKPVSQYL